MRYYIISGEASGDLHASALVRELKKLDPHAQFRGWGGDKMQDAGVNIVKHYRELAFMGFVEVIANLRTILRNIDFCKNDIVRFSPDALILVDYPGFNLRIAKFARSIGLKVFYYISPQVWAWKPSRVMLIKKAVDRMFVILSFEKEFYKKFDYDVSFVGHPLLDAIGPIIHESAEDENSFRKNNKLSEQPIVALLPGSRKQEISIILPVMLKGISGFDDLQFVIGAAPSVPLGLYESIISKVTGNDKRENIHISSASSYELLRASAAAIVTSGTATLETALFGVPEMVCYKGSFISFQIAKKLIQVKYISLVNLILDKPVVRELIQNDLTPRNIRNELKLLLYDASYRGKMIQEFQLLRQILGGGGASAKTASEIFEWLSRKPVE